MGGRTSEARPLFRRLQAMAGGEVTTPKGTVLITLIYGLTTAALWTWIFLDTLRAGGVVGGR
ncbi:MAG: hypothetical protein IRY95_01075 [Clostridia bacterium]|nr:hypothetical protein [Clostridia bacterium]